MEDVDLELRFFVDFELREDNRRLPMLCFFSFLIVSSVLISVMEVMEVTDGWVRLRVEAERNWSLVAWFSTLIGIFWP